MVHADDDAQSRNRLQKNETLHGGSGGFDGIGGGIDGEFMKTAKTRFGFPLQRPVTPHPSHRYRRGTSAVKTKTDTKDHHDGGKGETRAAFLFFSRRFPHTRPRPRGDGDIIILLSWWHWCVYFDARRENRSGHRVIIITSSRSGGESPGGGGGGSFGVEWSSRALYRQRRRRYSVLRVLSHSLRSAVVVARRRRPSAGARHGRSPSW